ncbi:hypothetical protein J2Z77_000523 [Streptomyces avidinii]|uniref:Uncharacterized protein n=1 Tax=Streptomyces avidinii TaxID=1895 RepID=A0ABS4KXH9_STRAV|nr:hypothetical protein [Streptomyces avidinii]
MPDRDVEGGGAPWGREGPVELVVGPRCAEVGLEAGVGGVLRVPDPARVVSPKTMSLYEAESVLERYRRPG